MKGGGRWEKGASPVDPLQSKGKGLLQLGVCVQQWLPASVLAPQLSGAAVSCQDTHLS